MIQQQDGDTTTDLDVAQGQHMREGKGHHATPEEGFVVLWHHVEQLRTSLHTRFELVHLEVTDALVQEAGLHQNLCIFAVTVYKPTPSQTEALLVTLDTPTHPDAIGNSIAARVRHSSSIEAVGMACAAALVP